ncbi:RHS repeat-associated core domain-containing protein [Lentisphaerota bacterium WC36G]|nr:RHS repeat-associated core domain-containing protein [Lentisphaerae bacterium WC36]
MALEKDGVAFNYIADGNKNITQLIDMSSGSVANRYDYSPFGQLIADVETVENPFKFSSEYAEKETGLIYYNYRYYNPTNSKWTKRDPIQEDGGMNVYGFVNNNVINLIDLLGGKPSNAAVNPVVIWKIAEYIGAIIAGIISSIAYDKMFKNEKCDEEGATRYNPEKELCGKKCEDKCGNKWYILGVRHVLIWQHCKNGKWVDAEPKVKAYLDKEAPDKLVSTPSECIAKCSKKDPYAGNPKKKKDENIPKKGPLGWKNKI